MYQDYKIPVVELNEKMMYFFFFSPKEGDMDQVAREAALLQLNMFLFHIMTYQF